MYPPVSVLPISPARACRAMPGAILGSSRAGEQTLLKRLARRRPELFAGRVTCFDRNFPGHELIKRDPGRGRARRRAGERHGRAAAGARRLAARRIPDDLAERPVRGNKQDRLPVRAAEHNVILPCGDGKEVSETCTVITTLLDHGAAAADQVPDTYSPGGARRRPRSGRTR